MATTARGDFHITLPSNVITDAFPNNTSSDYEIPLPTAIDFGGSTYEVALAEIFFPHTWYNIPDTLRTVSFRWIGRAANVGLKKFSRDKEIPPGYYGTAQELVKALESLKPDDYKGRFSLNPVNNLVQITAVAWQEVWMDKRLAQILGFKVPNTNEMLVKFVHSGSRDRTVHKAEFMCDPNPTSHAVFVYCSIIQESLLGMQYARLLRMVPTRGEHGKTLHFAFDKPLFVEIPYDRISSIRLTLCDDQGQAMKFTAGKTICRLHFRRKLQTLV